MSLYVYLQSLIARRFKQLTDNLKAAEDEIQSAERLERLLKQAGIKAISTGLVSDSGRIEAWATAYPTHPEQVENALQAAGLVESSRSIYRNTYVIHINGFPAPVWVDPTSIAPNLARPHP